MTAVYIPAACKHGTCSWGVCNSNSKYGEGAKTPRLDMTGVCFFRIPLFAKYPDACRQWVRCCNRKDFTVDNVTRLDNDNVTRRYKKGRKARPDNELNIMTEESIEEREESSAMNMEVPNEDGTTENEDVLSVLERGTQTQVTNNAISVFSTKELTSIKHMKRALLERDIMQDDESSKYLTGLTRPKLRLVFDLIEGKASRLVLDEQIPRMTTRPKELSAWQEFLLCLLRLRRGLGIQHLSKMFSVSQSVTSSTINAWVNFVFHELNFLVTWPTKEQSKHQLPKAFKAHPNTRIVIDCTEFSIQQPSLPTSQRITWSAYKSHNTAKALIGVTPHGTIAFLSKLWTGNTSDRKIVMNSGFLDKLEPSDHVMADRGFFIRDLLALRDCTLNIPTFLHGRQMAAPATTKTRRIARARIVVEMAIGRLKYFKILDGVIPLTVSAHLDEILFVCVALSNLEPRLIK